MNENNEQINNILKELAESLDISPTDYKRAVASYLAVGTWLEDGYMAGFYPQCNKKPEIYPQGSINLGTIVRPIKDGKEADYDIDLVCELKPLPTMKPEDVKNQVGNRIKENEIYRQKIDKEGKRCWTLEYAKSSGIGFHLDVLPCIPNGVPTNISITHKAENKYEWRYGNPKGYANWFKEKNTTFQRLEKSQKQYISENTYLEDNAIRVFAEVEDVPDQLVKTPLQRAIQIMKRHRDIHFGENPKNKPISIIITTLAAHVYNGEMDIYSALTNIVDKLSKHSGLLQDMYFSQKLEKAISILEIITKRINNEGVWEWYIPNPLNPEENFADQWHKDNDIKAKLFFNWLEKLNMDIDHLKQTGDLSGIGRILQKSFLFNRLNKYKDRLSQKNDQISFPNISLNKGTNPWKSM